MARKSRKVFNTDIQKPVQKTEVVFKTAIYVRLSKEDSRCKNENSIESQIDLVKQYVLSKPYLQLCEVFADNGYTGTNLDRPEFKRMMEEIKKGNINCCVTKDSSRLSRNYLDVGDYLEKIFPFMGVRFISVNDNYDTGDTSADKESLTIALKSLVNDAYVKDLRTKIKSSLDAKRKNGEFIGNYPPYGYTWNKEVSKKFIIDVETATIVRNIFNWKLEGLACMAIAKKLNELNIIAPYNYFYNKGYLKNKKYLKKYYWEDYSVKRILTNQAYIGDLVQGKYTNNELFITKDAHDPIIDKNLFEKVQSIMDTIRQKAYKQKDSRTGYEKSDNLLRGLLVCGECGRKVKRYSNTTKSTKMFYQYYCYNCKKNNKTITPISITEKQLLGILEFTILSNIKMFVNYESIILKVKETDATKFKLESLRKDIFLIKQNITKKETQLQSIYEDFKDDLLTKEEYLFAKEKYIQEHTKLKQNLMELQAELSTYNDGFINDNKFVVLVNNFKENLSINRVLLESIIDKITIYSDKNIEITYKFKDEFEALLKFAKENGVNLNE